MESAALSVLVQQLRAAGEVTRARILALLAHGELSVGNSRIDLHETLLGQMEHGAQRT